MRRIAPNNLQVPVQIVDGQTSTDPVLNGTEFNKLRLDQDCWTALFYISRVEKRQLSLLIADINQRKRRDVSLATACRVVALGYLLNVQKNSIDIRAIEQLCKKFSRDN